ncbi:MAG: hypothetical protein NT080_11390 [Spirochaetes bacterium]|nr:hypothetical protein [Spirochaetota bacterium]
MEPTGENCRVATTGRDPKSIAASIASIAGMLCFLLPFVSIKSCGSEEIVEYRGYELMARSNGWLYALVLGIGLVFAVGGFVRIRTSANLHGFLGSGAALLAAACCTVVVAFPSLQFILDTVESRVGHMLASLCWVVVFGLSSAGAVAAFAEIGRVEGRVIRVPTLQPLFWRFVLGILGIASFALPILPLLDSSSADSIPQAAGILVFMNLPWLAVLYFLCRGLGGKERWTRAWGPIVGVASVAFAVYLVFAMIS